MKHKIVIEYIGSGKHLCLYRKKGWYSGWEYIQLAENSIEGRQRLEAKIETDNIRPEIIAEYRDGKQVVKRDIIL